MDMRTYKAPNRRNPFYDILGIVMLISALFSAIRGDLLPAAGFVLGTAFFFAAPPPRVREFVVDVTDEGVNFHPRVVGKNSRHVSWDKIGSIAEYTVIQPQVGKYIAPRSYVIFNLTNKTKLSMNRIFGSDFEMDCISTARSKGIKVTGFKQNYGELQKESEI